MRQSTRFSVPAASNHIAPALAWAERNLGQLARLSASRIDVGADDHLHLRATLALLRARQQIRTGLTDLERAAREVRS